MFDDLYKEIAVVSGAMYILERTYRFCRFIAPRARKTAIAIWLHLPPVTRRQWFERAISQSTPLLSALAERAMEEHCQRAVWVPAIDGREGWWIPPSKPGPSHPVYGFLAALEECEFDPSRAEWEQLRRFGSESVDSVWKYLENREGIQHPLTPFRNL